MGKIWRIEDVEAWITRMRDKAEADRTRALAQCIDEAHEVTGEAGWVTHDQPALFS